MFIHMEKTFKAMQCQKTEHLQKSIWFLLVPVQRFQYFRHILQNPNLKIITSFPNNHYWAYTFLNLWALEEKWTEKNAFLQGFCDSLFVLESFTTLLHYNALNVLSRCIITYINLVMSNLWNFLKWNST